MAADDRSRDLTHLDERGRAVMVDVGGKASRARRAIASARLRARPEVIAAIRHGQVPKGDVLAVARVAGIVAAKRTAELIPLCHPLPLNSVRVDLELLDDQVVVRAEVACHARTGVEMEALTAAAVAALTLYDMCKALDRGMVIEGLRVETKVGGDRGDYRFEDDASPG